MKEVQEIPKHDDRMGMPRKFIGVAQEKRDMMKLEEVFLLSGGSF